MQIAGRLSDMAFRTRRQPRWAAATMAVLFGLAALFTSLSIAGADGPPGIGRMLAVLGWAFVSGMCVGDLFIPLERAEVNEGR